jgi:2-polyprenyl-6-hydroxyphenyl methylase/3-demethylubiquinone-9 3-methyltransferase
LFQRSRLRALDLYDDQPLSVRLHTRIRAATAPLGAIADRCPDRGSLLDVGCGHGLLSNEVALRHPRLSVLGIDVAENKVLSAQATVKDRVNVHFEVARVDTADPMASMAGVASVAGRPTQLSEGERFDVLLVADVLYLIPMPNWPAFLESCRRRLRSGGRLLLKEVTTHPRFKFLRLRAQEWLAVHAFGITEGSSMHFEPVDAMVDRLQASGFSDIVTTPLDRGYWTPHVLFEARGH